MISRYIFVLKWICIPLNPVYLLKFYVKKSQYLLAIFMIKNMSRINFFNEKENENDNDNDNENDQCLHRLNKIYFKAHK